MKDLLTAVSTVIDNIERVIIGKRAVIEKIMVSLLCEGHVLLEDIPGVGKTMLARALATSIRGNFNRVQCTPDLLPNDITGVYIFNQETTQFEFRPGPIFVNILLVDEINRATPRTQSALLESMQERQVTVDGVTQLLPRPFLVMATQNPIEHEGTFPLPEAQLDRFLMRLSMGYPAQDDEKTLFTHLQYEHPIHKIQAVLDAADLLPYQQSICDVYVEDSLQDYILKLVMSTRNHSEISLGVSPRASVALYKASQALAAVRGRDHVIPDDIQELAASIFTHRLIITPEASLRGRTPHAIMDDILESTPLALESSE